MDFSAEYEHVRLFKDKTLGQILTFAAVCEARSIRGGGRITGHDPRSTAKMIASLEKPVMELSTQELFATKEWGGEVTLTPAGQCLRDLCKEILSSVNSTSKRLQEMARQPAVKIGLATFTDDLYRNILSFAKRHDFTYTGAKDIPSGRILEEIRSGSIDFCLGPILAFGEMNPVTGDAVEFLGLQVEELGLLSSYEFPGPIAVGDLLHQRLPLIAPDEGVIHDLLRNVFASDLHKLNVLQWSSSVREMLSRIRWMDPPASMVATRSLFDSERAKTGPRVYFSRFRDCPYRVEVGVFRRTAKRGTLLRDDHPLAVLWHASETYLRSRRRLATQLAQDSTKTLHD